MLSFLNETRVETPCLDFFKKMPKEAFTGHSSDIALLDMIQGVKPCVYGDQMVGDKEKWGDTMSAELFCSDLLREDVRSYLNGERIDEKFSSSLQLAIIHGIDKSIQKEGISHFLNKVENDFMFRKIQLAFEQKPEVVKASYPVTYFMHQLKNAPSPLRHSEDVALYKTDLFETEDDREQHFSKLFFFAMRKQRGLTQQGEKEPMSFDLFDRICDAMTWGGVSSKEQHPYRIAQHRLEELRQKVFATENQR